jgi:glutamate-1-semialdehyde aminotransferase
MSAINLDRSIELYRAAQDVLPAGVSSNARVWRAVCPTYMPCSIFVSRAKGSHL